MTMTKAHLKTAFKERTTVVDKDTGEIIDEQIIKHTYVADTKEQFFLGYVSMLSTFKDVSGPAIKVYAYLLQFEQPGKLIGITAGVKDKIREFIGSNAKGNKVIDNALAELVNVKLLLKGEGRGGYYLNPRYAFKGSTKERAKSLKTIIELVCSEA